MKTFEIWATCAVSYLLRNFHPNMHHLLVRVFPSDHNLASLHYKVSKCDSRERGARSLETRVTCVHRVSKIVSKVFTRYKRHSACREMRHRATNYNLQTSKHDMYESHRDKVLFSHTGRSLYQRSRLSDVVRKLRDILGSLILCGGFGHVQFCRSFMQERIFL